MTRIEINFGGCESCAEARNVPALSRAMADISKEQIEITLVRGIGDTFHLLHWEAK